MITLELPVPPSANRIWRVGKGRTYLAPEYKLWLKKARLAIQSRYRSSRGGAGPLLVGPVEISIVWYRHAKRGDLDNKIKPTLDALKGLVIKDDSQVWRVTAERVEAARDAIEVIIP